MKRTCLQRHTTCRDSSGNTDEFRVNRGDFHSDEISFSERLFVTKDNQLVKGFVRMKLHLFKNIPFYIACFLLNLNLSGQKVILSIGEGENILFPESSISLNDARGGIQVCTVDDSGNFYAYTGGNKKGPFSKIEDAFKNINFHETNDNSENQSDFENKTWNEKFVKVNEKGESFIHARGKIFGPYSIVKELYFSPDENQFAATTGLLVNSEKFLTEFYLISSECPEIKLKGEPGSIKASKSLKTVCVCTEEIIRQEIDQKEIEDYSNKLQSLMKEFENGEMSVDDINKLGEKMEKIKKPETVQPQNNYYIYSNTGICSGSFQSCPAGKNLGFGMNSLERWHYMDSGKLFVNGKLQKDYGRDLSIKNFWWSKTGSNYAFSTYDELIFSDGKIFPFPLEVQLIEKNGKSILEWLALEEKINFVLYQKEL